MSSLYVDHFGLQEVPFGITPNSKFFFDGQTRGAILQALCHSVMDEDGIIVVVGAVGSGKTMLCRKLAEELSEDSVDLVYLANPAFGPQEILHSIVADWGLELPPDRPVLLGIQDALMERHLEGRRVVLLIDEAQAMPPDSLEEIKLLSNLETAQRKLLQIVLFGQEELDDLLALPRLRQVKDRVVQRFDLPPLGLDESIEYIQQRLVTAGSFDRQVFSRPALVRLARASSGRIRAIHLLADKAMLAAYAAHAEQVDLSHVRQAAKEVRLAAQGKRRPPNEANRWGALMPRLRTASWVGGGVAALLVAWWLMQGLWAQSPETQVLASRPYVAPEISGPTGTSQRLGSEVQAPEPARTPLSSEPPPPMSVQPPPAPVAPSVSGGMPALTASPDLASAPTPVPDAAPPQRSSPVAAIAQALPPAEPARVVALEPTRLSTPATNPSPERYAHLTGPFKQAVLATRQVFDDPRQTGWTIEVARSDSTAGAMKVWLTAARVGPTWVQDREPGTGGWPKESIWAVYIGRYHSLGEAQKAQNALQSQLPYLRLEPRSLESLRATPYPDHPPV